MGTFSWSLFPRSTLTVWAKAAGLPGVNPAAELAERYGTPPGEPFIQELWPHVRDSWLAARPEPRAAVVAELQSAGLGNASGPLTSAAAQRAYLRSCRNGKQLRAIVLRHLMQAGAGANSSPTGRAVDPETEGIDWFQVLSALGVGEALRVDSSAGHILTIEAGPTGSLRLLRLGADPVTFARHQTADLVAHTQGVLADHDVRAVQRIDNSGLSRLLSGELPDAHQPGDEILDRTNMPLREQVGRFLAQRMGMPYSEVRFDSDGDIPFTVGSAVFFVRAHEDSGTVILFSPLLLDLAWSEGLSRTLHDWSGINLMRFRWVQEAVIAEIRLPAIPFIGQHLDRAVAEMFDLLDQLDDKLQRDFGGRRSSDPKAKPSPESTTGRQMAEGGYL